MKDKYFKTCPKHKFYRLGDLYFSFEHLGGNLNLCVEIQNQKRVGCLINGANIPANAKKITEAEFNLALEDATRAENG